MHKKSYISGGFSVDSLIANDSILRELPRCNNTQVLKPISRFAISDREVESVAVVCRPDDWIKVYVNVTR